MTSEDSTATSAEPLVRLRGIVKAFGSTTVLDVICTNPSLVID